MPPGWGSSPLPSWRAGIGCSPSTLGSTRNRLYALSQGLDGQMCCTRARLGPVIDRLLLGAHVLSVCFCAGLVWVIQLLVYPGFAAVGPHEGWREFHDRHTRTMATLVTGPWAVQGLTCAWLLVAAPVSWPFAIAAGVCGAVTVAVTVLVSVPCHQRLSQGYDATVLDRLVRTNWYRTAAWSAGALVAVAM